MLANNLKSLRKQRKLTLDELAEALGTSRQTIHRYENGTITNIPPEKVEKLPYHTLGDHKYTALNLPVPAFP